MKKIVFIGLLLVSVVAFAACGSVEQATPGNSDAVVEDQQATQAEDSKEIDSVMTEEGDLGDCHIKIVSAQKGKDYSDKEALIVTYEWTNNSDEEKMFGTTFTAKAYQNGVECSPAYMVDGVDSQKTLTNIKPGAALEIQAAYLLTDNSDVTIEVSPWISFDDKKVVKVFSVE